jgi:hypothetical protein
MKLPRGFGKNYFSLNAITATVNQVTLQQEVSRVQNFHTHRALFEQDEEELEELDELTLCQTPQLSLKSCHCNCFFKSLTFKTLKLFSNAKKNTNYYIFLNSTISPPQAIFNKSIR